MARPHMRNDLLERMMCAESAVSFVTPASPTERHRLNDALSRGELVSPVQNVYALADTYSRRKPTERALMSMRALQAAFPDYVFCGSSAALVYGLAVTYGLLQVCHVATSRKAHTRSCSLRGIVRHIVEDDEVTDVDGLRVTSFARTVFDCLRASSFRYGLPIADSALASQRMGREELVRACASFDYHFPGRRRALATLDFADPRAESGGESVARAVMIERGFRLPELQVEMSNPLNVRDRYRVDFFWRLGHTQDVIGELDGREKYVNPDMTGGRSTLDVLADERLRESRVSAFGAKILRFSYRDVLDGEHFARLLSAYGIPRDAEVPWVARRRATEHAHREPSGS